MEKEEMQSSEIEINKLYTYRSKWQCKDNSFKKLRMPIIPKI